jgi:hypothetical protein
MAKKERSATKSNKAVSQKHEQKSDPGCVAIVHRGLRLGTDFAEFMAAVAGDVATGLMTPSAGNATCNATGKVLKIYEMQQKYGAGKPLRLAGPPTA